MAQCEVQGNGRKTYLFEDHVYFDRLDGRGHCQWRIVLWLGKNLRLLDKFVINDDRKFDAACLYSAQLSDEAHPADSHSDSLISGGRP